MPFAVRMQYRQERDLADHEQPDPAGFEPIWLEDDMGERRLFASPEEAEQAALAAPDAEWRHVIVEVE